ncbi:hypothetical protein SBRCBS47491_010215 [Sporothrix bragantina]|uniref:Siderophore esterase IroE-like protein n=1 Tax=Sporothrix bragantina TaxID=671064 RepID=A0ABP0D0L0_9PEZI
MTAVPANSQVCVTNTLQRFVETEHGLLQVMVSWPLGWKGDGTPPHDEDMMGMPVFFLLDGNAYFLTATDVVRRQQYVTRKKSIVVGIGYSGYDTVYVPLRRSFDLTPPASKGLPQRPIIGVDGKEEKDEAGNTKYYRMGGAASFHETIKTIVVPMVARDMLPGLPWDSFKKVLFGHSFGGLFTLFSLFTDPGVFDIYVAGSPSIWFNDCALEEHEKHFLEITTDKKPLLYINSGSAEEDDIFRKPQDTDEKFKEREEFLKSHKMNTYAREMAKRMEASGKLREVWLQEFSLEDHGGAAVVGLQRSINKVLGEWWEGK